MMSSLFYTFTKLLYLTWPPSEWGTPSLAMALPIATFMPLTIYLLALLGSNWSFWSFGVYYSILCCYTPGVQCTLIFWTFAWFFPALCHIKVRFWKTLLYYGLSALTYGIFAWFVHFVEWSLVPPSFTSWYLLFRNSHKWHIPANKLLILVLLTYFPVLTPCLRLTSRLKLLFALKSSIVSMIWCKRSWCKSNPLRMT